MNQQNTGLTIIYLSKSIASQNKNQRRAWNIVVTHNGVNIHPHDDMSFDDPWLRREYPANFKFLVDDSFQPYRYDRSAADNNTQLQRARSRIRDYGTTLLVNLGLDRQTPRVLKIHDVFIVEDLEHVMNDDESLHNIVWELLEDPQYWAVASQERVTVTRIIMPNGINTIPRNALPRSSEWSDKPNPPSSSPSSTMVTDAPDDTSSPGLDGGKPLRMLLVIGRCLKHERVTSVGYEYAELVTPGIIQQAIMQINKHLEEIGHTRTVQLEILRPGTFDELKAYLGVDSKTSGAVERFDIIHLDMHGRMWEKPGSHAGPSPHFMFTWVPLAPPCYIPVREVASTLSKCTDLLVMNACNSSSLSGQLGINMVRTFLQADMGCVSATSYRLLVSAAKIFYPHFYMSFFLHGSFNRAAADARAALRKNKIRLQNPREERDDHFVHWNWSRTLKLAEEIPPLRSNHLFRRMLFQSVPRGLCYLYAHFRSAVHMQAWHDYQADDYPMYSIHRQFSSIERHVRCAQRNNIPRINLHILEIEYYLRTSPKHSVYLYPPFREGPELRWISNMIRDTIRIWLETNFVSEVRVLDVKSMLNGDYSTLLRRPLVWAESWYADRTYYPRNSSSTSLKQPKIRKMLIIDGFEQLDPQEDWKKQQLLTKIGKIAQAVEKEAGGADKYYMITIGAWEANQWTAMPTEFERRALGYKWTGADVRTIMLPLTEDTEMATYEYQRPKR